MNIRNGSNVAYVAQTHYLGKQAQNAAWGTNGKESAYLNLIRR